MRPRMASGPQGARHDRVRWVLRAPNAIAGGDPTPGSNKGGRPSHAGSDENRRQVKVMAARLMPQEAIAAVIGINTHQEL